MSSLVRDGEPEVLAGLRAAQRGALARLVPEIGSDADRVGDPDTERLLLLEGTTELLAAMSQLHPVLVVLDDLHWADTATLQLLRHVIASTTPMNVTIACTYRDTDLGRSDPLNKLLADLHREANVSRVALHGLEDDELVELIAAAAGHDLDDDGVGLAHALRRETDGNPFFTGEMLRHLGESGGIVLGDDGRWTVMGELAELGLPSSVRDVVGRRVERLGDEASRVLSLAAVIGREFGVDLFDRVDRRRRGRVAGSPGRGRRRGSSGRERRRRPVSVRARLDPTQSLRRALLRPVVQRAHQRIAETLETPSRLEDAAMLAELAHHWVAATAARRPRQGPRATCGRPATPPATRSRPTTPSAGINKPSTSSTARPHPTNTNAPSSSPRSVPPNGKAGTPSSATRCCRPPTSPNSSTTPTCSSGPRSALRPESGLIGDDDAKRVAVGRARPRRDRPDADARPASRRARRGSRRDPANGGARRDLALQAVDTARRSRRRRRRSST